ncbi:phosphonate C-P lyase system protein PhnH [Paenibacillus frigoriresistens]|uniref:phosphonate C-P lyase system protein PhnH n=1 Tax=Paenibacillus alginolyticus TaxID=59839 RepID=UPI0015673147|nr:phosphonate C-P lyase system protein PhnH [Paenibacillus frigoriresistens]NRF94606.1 phosphonate C-P lyase system protein PhnH [Paenibacillus frigoriresistens]
MKLDLVHDIQTSYRKVVDSMSRPGLISDLSEEVEKLDMDAGCFPSTLVLAMMLLDTEVTFKVFSEKGDQVTHLFRQLTYAKTAETDQADFIFILQDAAVGDLQNVLDKAKIGTLIDPHDSATIIVESVGLSEDTSLRLMGPGIEHAAFAQILLNVDWMELREERNAEFPLGLDLIFIDSANHLLCLPRTTQITKEGGS